MIANNLTMIKRLQGAINSKFDTKILVNTSQWYNVSRGCPMTAYTIRQQVNDPETGKNTKVTLFETYSKLQAVLYLRDYWYYLNGWEVPEDNEIWNNIKQEKGITYGS